MPDGEEEILADPKRKDQQMMDIEKAIQAGLAVITGMLSAYFHLELPWLVVLVTAMGLDYLTGIGAAAYQGVLSSEKGFKGILKKAGTCVLVAVTLLSDWALAAAGTRMGFGTLPQGSLVLVVIIWIITNEIISILENLGQMDVPMPHFLMRIIKQFKEQLDAKNGDNKQDGEK